jgi:hypothetical protein
MIKKLFKLNLRHFDGAAAPSAGSAPTGEASTSAAGKNQGAAPQVLYGRQPDTVDAQEQSQAANENPSTITTSDSLEARKTEFEKLIQGEYKDLFTERTQSIIDKRFKETKNMEKQITDIQPVLDILGQKYGVSDGDMSKLIKSIEEDDSFFEEEATKRGLTVEQYKYMRNLERQNTEYAKARQEFEARQGAQEAYNQWVQQSDKVKEIYPGFDLNVEASNADFVTLLKSGIDVKTAFEVMHHDEILGGAMQYAAEKTREATANNIKARNLRPSENGISSQTGVIVKDDVSKLTPADRAEAIRRAQRGEHITFGR